MSQLTNCELQNIATLSKLTISDNSKESLKNDLINILELVEKIQQVNTDNIKPMAHPLDATQSLREDISEDNKIKKDLQSLSKHIKDDLYLSPKVID